MRDLIKKRVLVTGGAGFIGSAVARRLINQSEHLVLVLDKLTYKVGKDPSYARDHDWHYGVIR